MSLESQILEAYNAHHIYDIICLSETYLDSSVHYDDPKSNLCCYKLVGADNLSKNKRGGAGICFKETRAVRQVTINILKVCILLEVFIRKKRIWIITI